MFLEKYTVEDCSLLGCSAMLISKCTSWFGITSLKTCIFINTIVRTSNKNYIFFFLSFTEKDVSRTDRTLPFFAGENNVNLQLLSDILMTYVMYNFDLGYVQGMSDLLSPILFVMSDEVDAFWCFVGFMDKVVTFPLIMYLHVCLYVSVKRT